MLQASADAAALAAAIEPPDETAAIDTARAYAVANMRGDIHGTVLARRNVVIGRWAEDSHTILIDDLDPETVWVTVQRSPTNNDPVPVNFLRILGLQTRNVRAQAVAQTIVPRCIRNGLGARRYRRHLVEQRFHLADLRARLGGCVHAEQ